MTARASVYYDASYLVEVLHLEDVTITGTEVGPDGSCVGIRLEGKHLVDDLVTVLAKIQRERQVDALRSQVKQLNKDYQAAEVLRDSKRVELADAQDRLDHTTTKYQEARHALAALEGATK